jgi:hypothetical protein
MTEHYQGREDAGFEIKAISWHLLLAWHVLA